MLAKISLIANYDHMVTLPYLFSSGPPRTPLNPVTVPVLQRER